MKLFLFTGNFSVGVCSMQLQRNSLHYILCSFIPCLLMIFLSYYSMWIIQQKSTQRFNLNLFALGVIMLFQYNSLCLTIRVPYLKAIDIFIGICSCFSILSLLESSFVMNSFNLDNKFYHTTKGVSSPGMSKLLNLTDIVIKFAFPVFLLFFISIYIYLYLY